MASDAESERECIAAYFEHLASVQVGVIDLTGCPACEVYAFVASWIRNRVDVTWAEEMAQRKPLARGEEPA